jgi:hypothetical protein
MEPDEFDPSPPSLDPAERCGYHLTVTLAYEDRSLLRDILAALTRLGDAMSAETDAVTALTATVTAEVTVERSAVTLIDGIGARIAKAVQDAIAAGADPATLKSITDATAAIAAESAQLAAAVAANTPAASPAPPPPPPPTPVTG